MKLWLEMYKVDCIFTDVNTIRTVKDHLRTIIRLRECIRDEFLGGVTDAGHKTCIDMLRTELKHIVSLQKDEAYHVQNYRYRKNAALYGPDLSMQFD